MVQLGDTIRERRKKVGLTQRALGELCGYTGRYAEVMVQHWEHNRRQPDVQDLRALVTALKMTLDELIP